MAQERQRDQWAHTSLILSVIANIHRDPKKGRRFTAEDFNPLQDRKAAPIRTGVGILKQIFIDNRRRDSAK